MVRQHFEEYMRGREAWVGGILVIATLTLLSVRLQSAVSWKDVLWGCVVGWLLHEAYVLILVAKKRRRFA